MPRRRSGPGAREGFVMLAAVGLAGVLVWGAAVSVDETEPPSGAPAASDEPAPSGDPPPPGEPAPSAEPEPSGWGLPVLADPGSGIVDVDASTTEALGRATLDLLIESAPVVVTTSEVDGPEADVAADLARSLRAPVLVVGDGDGGDADLLDGWGTQHVVAVGSAPEVGATVHPVGVQVPEASSPSESSPPADGTEGTDGTDEADGAGGDEPVVTVPDAVEAMVEEAADQGFGHRLSAVVRTQRSAQDDAGPDWSGVPVDLRANLEALQVHALPWSNDDPRSDARLRDNLAAFDTSLLAVADDQWPDGPPRSTVRPDWPALFAITAQAPELVGGGLTLFPKRTFVATYGNPTGPALGVLGERDVEGSLEYVRDLASEYEGLLGDSEVQPAFEIIATIASSQAGPDGDYSRPEDLELITEWVDAAAEAGVYVVLDLQPGRTDFLTQAKALEDLLRRPHVGLALDPEWRLEPDEVHLQQIGSVTTEEVNEVADWLAELVRDEVLPEKLLMIHSFRLSMLTDRQDLRLHPELATMVHVDGQGPQDDKDETYRAITNAGPEQLWWGWKNFFDEDSPGIRSPEDTAAVEPRPHFISYQ